MLKRPLKFLGPAGKMAYLNAASPVPGTATMLHPARKARFHQPHPGLQRLQIETVVRTGRDNQPASAHRRRCEHHRIICRLKDRSKRKALSATLTRSGGRCVATRLCTCLSCSLRLAIVITRSSCFIAAALDFPHFRQALHSELKEPPPLVQSASFPLRPCFRRAVDRRIAQR